MRLSSRAIPFFWSSQSMILFTWSWLYTLVFLPSAQCDCSKSFRLLARPGTGPPLMVRLPGLLPAILADHLSR